MNKICTNCNVEKSLDKFYACKKSPGGYRTMCKICCAETQLERKKKKGFSPKLPINNNLNEFQLLLFKKCCSCELEKTYLEYKVYMDRFSGYCISCTKQKSQENYKENKNKIKDSVRKWRKDNPEKIREYQNTPQVKWRHRCRQKIQRYIRFNSDAILHKFIGCTSNELKRKLAAQFKDGMDWENYCKVWNVDHIIPLCKFDLTIEQNRFDANHWSNLRPAWIKDNGTMTEEQRAMPHRDSL